MYVQCSFCKCHAAHICSKCNNPICTKHYSKGVCGLPTTSVVEKEDYTLVTVKVRPIHAEIHDLLGRG